MKTTVSINHSGLKISIQSNLILFFIILLVSSYPIYGSDNLPHWLTSEEKLWIQNLDHPIILAPDQSFAPIDIKNSDGSLGGIAGDYINLIEEMLDLKFTVKWYDNWSENVLDAEKGKIDIWSSVVSTPQRQKYMMFTDPYIELKPVFVVRDSFEEIPSLEMNGDNKLALIKGWYHTDLINNNNPDLIYSTVSSITEGLKMLKSGEINILITDILPATHLIKKHNLSGLHIAGDVPIDAPGLSIASTSKMPILHSILKKSLASITPEQRIQIYNKWVSIENSEAEKQNPDIVSNSVFIILFSILGILLLFGFSSLLKSKLQYKFLYIAILLLGIAVSTFILLNYYNDSKSKPGIRQSYNSNIELSKEERDWLSSLNAPLRVAPDSDFAPIEWGTDDGEFDGMAIDYLKLIENKLSTRFELLYFKTWADNRQAAKNRELDFWTAVAPTPQRRKFMSFSSPHIKLKATLLINNSENTAISLDSIEEQRIGVVKDYFTHHFLINNYPSISLELYKNSTEAIRALAFNQVDAVFIDIATASYIIKEEGISTIKISKVIDMGYNLSFASRKDYPILADILEKAVQSITPEEHSEIIRKWTNTSDDDTFQFKQFFNFLLILLAVISIMGIWVYLLKRAVLLRTQTIEKTKRDLQKANEYISTILNSMPSILIAVSPDGRVTQWNNQAYESTGIPSHEALDQPLEQLIPRLNNEKENIHRAIKENKVQSHTKQEHIENGKKYYEDITIYPLIVKGVEGVVIRIDDVTKEYELQQQFNQSRKMDAIGQLAGGVAHDFNNMLAGIMSSAQLLQSPKRHLDEKGLKFVEMIIDAANRAADLTAKLLTFGRKGEISSTPLDFHTVLDDTIAILSQTLDKKIKISVTDHAIHSTVIGNDSALQNVLINLGINSSQAMEGGGEIIFKTNNVFLSGEYCNSSQFDIEQGEYIEVEVRDTGIGISPHNMGKIFEPFFTTKENSKGSGLGLASVYGTVQNHNGAINVYSEVGSGTAFHIYLPCSDQAVNKELTEKKVLPGIGRILLVDDEELIRISCKNMLEEMGYKVLLSENGLDAVEIFEKNSPNIDIVIMDMIMPKMNGKDAFYNMKKIDKNCKVIISSGFTKDESLSEMKKDGLKGFIRKPYKNYELSTLLNEVFKEIPNPGNS